LNELSNKSYPSLDISTILISSPICIAGYEIRKEIADNS